MRTIPVHVFNTHDRIETFDVPATAFEVVAHLISFIQPEDEYDVTDPFGVCFFATDDEVTVKVWGDDAAETSAIMDVLTEAWRTTA